MDGKKNNYQPWVHSLKQLAVVAQSFLNVPLLIHPSKLDIVKETFHTFLPLSFFTNSMLRLCPFDNKLLSCWMLVIKSYDVFYVLVFGYMSTLNTGILHLFWQKKWSNRGGGLVVSRVDTWFFCSTSLAYTPTGFADPCFVLDGLFECHCPLTKQCSINLESAKNQTLGH